MINTKLLKFSLLICLFISTSIFAEIDIYKVKGDLSGVGVPVVIGSQEGIITNAHVVGNKSIVTVNLNNKSFVDFKVILKWPRSDIAFIIPSEENINIRKKLKKESYATFSPDKEIEYKIFKENHNHILTLDNNGKSKKMLQHSFVQPMSIPDYIISGEYNEILYLPFYARPGQSGSPYISDQKWNGILTKVTLGIYPESYAVKVSELNNLLQNYYFKNSPLLFEHNILTGTSGERIIFLDNGNYLSISGRQQVDTIGGGDIGNGARGVKNSLWQFNIKFLNQRYSYEVASPFNRNDSIVKYNDIELNFIIREKKGVYSILTPYIALFTSKNLPHLGKTYYSFKGQGQDYGEGIGFLTGRGLLDFKRKQSLTQSLPKYARLYLRANKTQFDLINMHIDTPLGDNAQALFPEFVNPPPGTIPQINKTRDFTLEDGRYINLHPFMPKRSDGYFMDIKMNELARFEHKQDWKKRPIEHFHFLMKDDLNSISIKDLDSGIDVILNKVTYDSISSIEYSNEDKTYRAILFYNNLNLTSIDRLLILSPSYLYEFISCKIGENACAR